MIPVLLRVDLTRQEYRTEMRNLVNDDTSALPEVDSVEGQPVDLEYLHQETGNRATAVLTSLNRSPADLTGLEFVDGEAFEPSITERALGGFDGSGVEGQEAIGSPGGGQTDITTTTTAVVPPESSQPVSLEGVGRIVSIVVLLVVLAVLARLIVTWMRRRTGVSETEPSDPPPVPARQTIGRSLTEAEQAEAEGRFDDALRLRYEAGLRDLNRLGVVTYTPSLPNGFYRSQVSHGVFDRLTDTFDETVYGLRSTDWLELESSKRDWAELLTDLTGQTRGQRRG
ncbi:MAG: hypothetical protein KJN81_04570 [Acidimicrobiia bacterium]|nr:hypothetical protein [Acidimicrobiia bacterium]NNL27684.1 hypothetical protein [Acidimicrobiia bacterium]